MLPSSSSESERIDQTIEKRPWNLDDIVLRRRYAKKGGRPEMLAHIRQRIGERW